MRFRSDEDMLPVRSGLGLFRPEFSTWLSQDGVDSTQVLSFAALSAHRNPEEKNHGIDSVRSIEAIAGRGIDHQAVASAPRHPIRFCQPSQDDGFTYLSLRRPDYRGDGPVLQEASSARPTTKSCGIAAQALRNKRAQSPLGYELAHQKNLGGYPMSNALRRSKVPRGYHYTATW
jgi:hypothetical protein